MTPARGPGPTGGSRETSGTCACGREGRRRILLVDCDMFFVQVARLEDPAGAGRTPLLLVGGAADGRGVVTSASYEVRRYGVRSGMPTAQALRLCPAARVVPVPRRACSRKSREVRSVLETLAPVVQAASVDEFYLDLSGTERLFAGETLEETGWRIRERVLEETEISVSVGGGTRRMIAKLAVNLAKPAGVHVVPPGEEETFMRGFELAAIPGIGPAFLDALARKGLRTVPDVLGVQPEWLETWFGAARAGWLRDRARGLDPTPVEPRSPRKSVSSERTFRRDLADPEKLDAALLRLVLSVGRGLRSSGLRARTVTVKARTPDFRTRTCSRTVATPIESDASLARTARELLLDLREGDPRGLRLLGVSASNLLDAGGGGQLPLFEDAPEESDRDRAVSHLADHLRDRFGEDALLPGRMVAETEPSDDGDEHG